MYRTSLTAAVAFTVLAASGCRVMHHNESAGQYVDDKTIEARAKAALIKDHEVSANDFTIEVYQGAVTLTGVAQSEHELQRAEADIRQVDGVKSVRNAARLAKSTDTDATSR